MINPALLVRSYLLYFILPLWVLAGLTDYFLHKRTRIEDTSGTTESALHLLQLGESGIPVIVALLFEINALVIGIMLFALIIHERRLYGTSTMHIHADTSVRGNSMSIVSWKFSRSWRCHL